jgi:glutaredoxin
MITLYSTHCPKCSVLEKKMTQKGMEFTLIDDEEEVVKFGKEHNMRQAPILDVGGEIMDFTMALKYIGR